MAHMRRFVGINAGVLDQHLLPTSLFLGSPPGGQLLGKGAATNANVDIARPSNLEFLDARNLADFSNNLFGDLARSLAKLLSQLEGQRQGILSQGHIGGLGNYDVFDVKLVLPPQEGANVLDKLNLKFLIQSKSIITKPVLSSQFSVLSGIAKVLSTRYSVLRKSKTEEAGKSKIVLRKS